jgi:aspartyl-tRNA(Asn)/glutamyl-tRNA(Gln) amidotransferase subunit A
MYLADIFNVQASLAGIPAISVPLFRHPNSMAVGMQLMGKKFDEENLLSFAARLTEMDFQTVDA